VVEALLRVPLPIIDPIVPTLAKHLPVGPEWRYEVKLDGFRGMLYIENEAAYFRSKSRKVMRRFQDLADTMKDGLGVRDAVLDGEIIVVNQRLPDFYALMYRRGNPEYAAFDLLFLNGRDIRDMAYTERKKRLEKILAKQTAIAYVESHLDPSLFEAAVRLDLEGIVAKRKSDPYARTTEWLKVKYATYSQAEGRWELFDRRR
jgi:bifunctional non-homologous end joining protein LigD